MKDSILKLVDKANEEIIKREFLLTRSQNNQEREVNAERLDEAKYFADLILNLYREVAL